MSAIGAGTVALTPKIDGPAAPAHASENGSSSTSSAPQGRSIDRAHAFLPVMMDAFQQGTTLRLVQSYADSGNLGSTAFTYDNALTIIAFLTRRTRDDMARAQVLGDGFLYAQAHDPTYSDGRLRQAYWVGPFTLPFASNSDYFVRPDGTVNLVGSPWFFQGSAVGDMAWAAISLALLHARTRVRRYLDGAVRLGNWIVDNAFSTGGLGGYTFGVDADNKRLSNKSLEHNTDVYGLFTNLLAPLTRDRVWTSRGQHARDFIERLWNPDGGYFWVGSPDGSTIQKSPVAEDTQSWPYLALLDRRFQASLDWAKTNLIATDTPQSLHASFTGNLRLSGVSFSDVSRRALQAAGPSDPLPDPDAVWFEGTSHLAAALLARRANRDLPTFDGDVATATTYLDHCALAQDELGQGQTVNGIAIPDGLGLVAASSVLNTGFGFSYFPNQHIGATSWYLIAAHRSNPFQLP